MLKRFLLPLSVSRAPALGAAAAALLLALTAAPAFANYCSHLDAQMRALDAGSRANPEQIARYDAAIVSQQRELQRAQMQSSQAGCSLPGIGGNAALCGSLGGTISRMATNLTDLQRTRDRLAASAGVARERGRLQQAMNAAGCGARQSAAAQSAPRPAAQSAATAPASQPGSGTTYRTLCVRMCDGFFFPISHATPNAMFSRDERLCSARCPGTRVELHYHRFPGEEAEDAVSVSTGRVYREGENAFRYRQASWERPGNCGCGIERGFDVLAGQQPADSADDEPTAAIAPEPLRATLEPRGSFLIRNEPQPVEEAAAPPPAEPVAEPVMEPVVEASGTSEDEAERPVRVVGPTFLPAPEAAIDLRAPAQSRAR